MDNDEIDLFEIYQVLQEEWRTLFGVTAVAAVMSVAFALVMTPYYRAEAVIVQVSSDSGGRGAALARQFGGLAGLAGVDLGGVAQSGQLATPYLKSRALLEDFIARNNLVPVLLPDNDDATLWLATKAFSEGVASVSEDTRSGLIRVGVEWTDPQVAAAWANGLVALANDTLRQRELEEAERNIAYLNARIAETSVVGIQQALFNLIENEMKTVMLANAKEEYAFAVVDPAVAPELKSKPKRLIMVMVGTLLGGFLALMLIGFKRLFRSLREREAAGESQA